MVVAIEVCGVGAWKGAGEDGLVAVWSTTSQETRLGGVVKCNPRAVLRGEIDELLVILVCDMNS